MILSAAACESSDGPESHTLRIRAEAVLARLGVAAEEDKENDDADQGDEAAYFFQQPRYQFIYAFLSFCSVV